MPWEGGLVVAAASGLKLSNSIHMSPRLCYTGAMKNNISRRNFLVSSTALAAMAGCTTAKPKAAAAPEVPVVEPPISAESGIRVRFLGSGAAGWKPEMAKKNPRRRTRTSAASRAC